MSHTLRQAIAQAANALGIGLLKRLARQNPAAAAQCIAGADAVLSRLPAHGSTRAQLAASVLGDAHALDAGCAVATLVLAVLRSTVTPSAAPDPGSRRPGRPQYA